MIFSLVLLTAESITGGHIIVVVPGGVVVPLTTRTRQGGTQGGEKGIWSFCGEECEL
jgi:hypothetical protein